LRNAVYKGRMNTNEDNPPQTIFELLKALREFKGITRKSVLGELMPILGENVYDDAGVLDAGGVKVVVSADGIVEDLVRDDPWLAGFYSVVVNVNDVVAKGARPLGYVHVLSSSSPSVRRQVVKGIKHGLDKYDLRFLKGHTHPDTSYDAIDSAIVGIAHNVLSSAFARPKDKIIFAVDLDGDVGLKGWVKTFDSVVSKTSKQVLSRLEAVIQLAEKELVHACRDVSGPGIIGTIAMLCESSHVGASIIIDDIPKPEDLSMQDWLTTYPSTGFVFSTNKPQKCAKLLRKHGLTANVVGMISSKRAIRISYRGQAETFMDLEKESIFGFKKELTVEEEQGTN
jgi:selenophosphate synthetase-related protein